MPKKQNKKNLNFDSFTVLESLCLLHCAFSLSLSLKREMKSSNTNALTVVTCQKVFIEVPVYDTCMKVC